MRNNNQEEEEEEEVKEDEKFLQILLQSFPGSSKTLEAAAKFCCTVKIDLTAYKNDVVEKGEDEGEGQDEGLGDWG